MGIDVVGLVVDSDKLGTLVADTACGVVTVDVSANGGLVNKAIDVGDNAVLGI